MGLKDNSGLEPGGLRTLSSLQDALFDVAITNTNSPINPGDTLVVDYSVDNTGGVSDTQEIRLEIDSVQEDSDAGVFLVSGETTTGSLEWVTGGSQTAQDYTATVLSADDSASQTVTVEAGSAIPDSVVNNLDIWLGMTEGSGTTTTADVGSLTATLHGGGWSSGVGYQDQVTTYDGTDDNLFADDSRALNETQYGLCAWVNITSFDDFAGVFSAVEADNSTAGHPTDGWRVDMSTGPPRLIYFDGGSSNQVAEPNADISGGSWYFVAFSGNGDSGSGYVWDTSAQQATDSGTTSRATGGSRWLRAMGGDNSRWVGGSLDAVGLAIGSAPSESDFAAIWNDTKANYP